MAVAAILDFER